MVITEHPLSRKELSTTKEKDDAPVEYYDELPTTNNGDNTPAAKKQAISTKLSTALGTPPFNNGKLLFQLSGQFDMSHKIRNKIN
ncbi:hypothetical protein MJO29_006636 [Puccinia striiformis f. sp. tritici]|nr:hypothetical protein MJO29_006636 [Puccinia striiformis f. sp. tritici]KAI9619715.1 hypothetical protein H4Q26_014097 [Puccinia striiformis f. sp. tritici PST-130]KAI9629339.1 hypothetical protein KEM48_013005 [Puccinia striiformis f. sp. tritici PST-130]